LWYLNMWKKYWRTRFLNYLEIKIYNDFNFNSFCIYIELFSINLTSKFIEIVFIFNQYWSIMKIFKFYRVLVLKCFLRFLSKPQLNSTNSFSFKFHKSQNLYSNLRFIFNFLNNDHHHNCRSQGNRFQLFILHWLYWMFLLIYELPNCIHSCKLKNLKEVQVLDSSS
jgi:hypothetical protein